MSNKIIFLDIEVYPNKFCLGILNSKNEHIFLDNINKIRYFLEYNYNRKDVTWVTFNGCNYDLVILEYLLKNNVTELGLYKKSKQIINNQDFNNKEKSWQTNHLDLIIFMTKANMCSLKEIGHRLHYPTLENLPYDYDKDVTDQEWEHIKSYNKHDLNITKLYYEKCISEYKVRLALKNIYDFHTLFSKPAGLSKKIFKRMGVRMTHDIIEPKGLSQKTYDMGLYKFIYKIMYSNVGYEVKNNAIKIIGKNNYKNYDIVELLKAIQHVFNLTKEDNIFTEHLVKKCVGNNKIKQKEFKEWLNNNLFKNDNKHVYEHKKIKFQFSVGGFHSMPNSKVYHNVYEYDFASMYPSFCIENMIGGSKFVEILNYLKQQRFLHKFDKEKKHSDDPLTYSNAYKLLINAITGCLKDPYAKDSVFSPNSSLSMLVGCQFTLIDMLSRINDDNKVILMNTDSLFTTKPLPTDFAKKVLNDTGLILECDTYDKLVILNVNSVLGIKNNKIIKAKKDFIVDDHNKNVSNPIIKKALIKYYLNNADIETYIKNNKNPFDFLTFTKVNKDHNLIISKHWIKEKDKITIKNNPTPQTDKRIRYYQVKNKGVICLRKSKDGTLSKLPNAENVKLCMDIKTFNFNDLNYDFYIEETKKIIEKINEK